MLENLPPPPNYARHKDSAAKRDVLNDKELRFVDAMIQGAPSASAAAVQAGYAPEYAPTVGPHLLGRADIIRMVQDGQRAAREIVAQRAGVQLSDVVGRLADIGLRDVAGFFDERGNPLPLEMVPLNLRASIEGLDVEEIREKGLRVGEVVKYKLAKPTVALDMLMRHLGGYELDNRQQSDPLRELLQAINERRGASILGPRDE